MSLENLSFLVLSPDLRSRTKLREVLRTCVYKCAIQHDRSLVGVADRLVPGAAQQKIDVLFLAASFGKQLLSDFMEECRRLGAAMPPVVIFIDDKKLEKSNSITSLYLNGVDGFISEPYSADEILQLIATLVSKGPQVLSAETKTKRAAEFMVSDAASKIDELALQQMQGEEPGGYALRDLHGISKNLQTTVEQEKEGYAEMLVNVFSRAKPASEAMLRRKSALVKKKIVHPASIIRDIMRTRKISVERLISSMKSEPAEIELLLKEQRSIDEAMAKDLSRALGMSWTDWMKVQKEYDTMTKKRGQKKS